MSLTEDLMEEAEEQREADAALCVRCGRRDTEGGLFLPQRLCSSCYLPPRDLTDPLERRRWIEEN